MKKALPWQVATFAAAALAAYFALRSPRFPLRGPTAPHAASVDARRAADPTLAVWGSSAVDPGDAPVDGREVALIAELGRARTRQAKCNVLEKLERLGGDAAARAIVDATLPYQHDEIRACATKSLTHVPGTLARDRLVAIAADATNDLRTTALEALAVRVDGRAYVEALTASSDPAIARDALVALALARAPGAAERIVAALSSAPARDIGALVQALGATGSTAALPALLELAAHGGDAERDAAYGALGEIGGPQAMAALREAAQHERTSTSALEALGQLDDEDARAALLDLARSGTPQRRGQALAHLVDSPSTRDEARTIAIELARGGGYGAYAALSVLGKDASPDATVALIAIARGPGAARAGAMNMLAQRRDPEALNALLAIAGEQGSHAQVLQALAMSRDSRALPLLQRAMASADQGERAVALRGLATMGGADADRALLDASSSGDVNLRREAVGLLAAQGSDAARARLSDLAKDADPAVAEQALGALVQRGDASASALVSEAWRDHPEQRMGLMQAVAGLGPEQAVPLLASALHEADSNVARVAIQQLATLGDPKGEAALLALLDDPAVPADVVTLAARMLQTMGGEASRAREADLVRVAGPAPVTEGDGDEGF